MDIKKFLEGIKKNPPCPDCGARGAHFCVGKPNPNAGKSWTNDSLEERRD